MSGYLSQLLRWWMHEVMEILVRTMGITVYCYALAIGHDPGFQARFGQHLLSSVLGLMGVLVPNVNSFYAR